MSNSSKQNNQQVTGVVHHEVGPDSAGQRLDNYLLKYISGVPRSHIYRLIRTGQVRVNGGRCKPTRRLQDGDTVRVPPLVQSSSSQVPDAVVAVTEASIVTENDDVIVFNKPAGLAVHAGSGLAFGLIDAIRQSRGDAHLELVHRLDRGTSGVLLVGKRRSVVTHYQECFRSGQTRKQYQAIADGVWQASGLRVESRLLKFQERGGQRRVVVDPSGKRAISHFTMAESLGAMASLLQIEIETGRTHQIRVHAASAGHALVGDELYGDKRVNQRYRQFGLKRMYLHAARLQVDDVDVSVEPAAEWQRALITLRQQPTSGLT